MKSKNQRNVGIMMSYLLLILDTLVSIIYTPILLKNLGDSQYGLYQLMTSMVNYLAIMDLGLGSTITRYVVKYRTENDKKSESNFLAISLIVYGVISVLILICGFLMWNNIGGIFRGLENTEVQAAKNLFALMCINLVVSLFDHAFTGVLTAYEQFATDKGLKISRICIRAFLVIVIIQFYAYAIVISIIELVLTVAILIIKILLCRKKVGVRPRLHFFDTSLLKEVFVFTAAILLQTIANQFNNNVDKTVLGIYETTATVAVYSVAMQLFSAYSGLSTAVQSVFLPKISKGIYEGNDDVSITRSLIQPSRLQFMILLAVLSGFWLYGKEFINLWCGKDEAWLIACLIMTAATLELFQNCTTSVLKAKKLLLGRTLITVGTAVANFVITVLLVPQYGMLGAACGTVFTLIVGYGIGNNIYYHRVGIRLKLFFKEVLYGILPAGIVSFIGGLIVRNAFASGTWITFGIKVFIYSAIYLVILSLIGLNSKEKETVKRYLKRKIR